MSHFPRCPGRGFISSKYTQYVPLSRFDSIRTGKRRRPSVARLRQFEAFWRAPANGVIASHTFSPLPSLHTSHQCFPRAAVNRIEPCKGRRHDFVCFRPSDNLHSQGPPAPSLPGRHTLSCSSPVHSCPCPRTHFRCNTNAQDTKSNTLPVPQSPTICQKRVLLCLPPFGL